MEDLKERDLSRKAKQGPKQYLKGKGVNPDHTCFSCIRYLTVS
jgi:hypothetical protein